MESTKLTVDHEVGLHARPAARFVERASQFPCEVKVRNVTREGKSVNAKSMLMVLSLAVSSGHEIEITTSGEQEEEALQALVELIENNFGD